MSDYELGRHDADINWLKQEVAGLREQMGEVLEFIGYLKGRKAAFAAAFVGLSSIVGIIVSIVLKVWP